VSLLRTVNLKKHFGETRAVDGVDFVVTEGEVLALVGPNGAGKTSLVNLLSAYLTPDSGEIIFLDQDITNMSVTERIKTGIARSFQIVNLFDDLTAFDNVALSIFSRENKTLKLMSLADHDHEVNQETEEVLAQFGLGDKGHILAKEMAQGERKLLDVAVAYALRPKFLFLDEPTSGVGTRDKDVVFKYSDRIVVMSDGKILADGSPDEIRANKEVETIFLGTG
jgi:branched-chain amino acid transport system ATP-binding protein